MKEKMSEIKEKNTMDQVPVLSLSVINLDIMVEEGSVYRGSFIVESENDIPIHGYIHSTNDKVEVDVNEFDSTHQEITYYFKGKLAVTDSEFEGDFVLITNAGEYNIPYRFAVTRKVAKTSIGDISNMEDFVKLYGSNRPEAKELFFLSNFSDVFLQGKPREQEVYHSLMKSRSRNLILEEFLVTCGYKKQAKIALMSKTIVLDSGKDKDTLTLQLVEDGYLEGRIYCEKGQLQLSMDSFTSDDFKNGTLDILVEKNQSFAMGSDVIHIHGIHEDIEVPTEWWGTLPAFTKEREEKNKIKKQRAELMHNYLYFRTGSVGFEDFAEDSNTALEDLYRMTGDVEWKLYQLHFSLMEEQMEHAQNRMEELEELEQKAEFSPLAHNYFLYLKALYKRNPETITNAVVSIRDFYAVSDHKAESLWMLIYLDREYVYNKRLQYDTIKQLFETGVNSCLLYFEACDILNDNPNYMSDLESFEISIFRWGLRYGYISLSLAYQFARLALKMKYYSSSIFYIAEKLYKVEPDERFLQVICSLLIKGNRTGKEYHEYFKLAVNANFKIIGLNEFFIRSMDFEQAERIPQRVLIYFTYSNSLDYMEKAYLYSNILKNKEYYDEVFGAYYSKMIPFVEEQLIKGRMNEHLAYLYSYFQKEILEKNDNAKAVCDILFYQKLTCSHKDVIGVYVVCPETGSEKYYPLSNGFSYVEIFNQRTMLFFVDSAEQRFANDIPYETQPFLSLEQFPQEWVKRNIDNKNVLLMLSGKVDEEPTKEYLDVFQKLAFNEDYKVWIREKALEALLVYYEKHQMKEELTRWLERTDYSNISREFRKQLMDYYLEVGMTENAYFGVELYGSSIMGAVKRLKLAVFGVQYYGNKKDDTTLSLAYCAFLSKKYNRFTLTYLMEFFKGELEDLLTIWERSRKFQLKTDDFEKRILEQAMFTGNDTMGVLPIFESFYEEKPEDEIVGCFLEYASMCELNGKMELNDAIHSIIGNEILEGRITHRSSMIYFLYYFADKEHWHEKIKDVTIKIMGQFFEEEFYLPIYHSYHKWMTFPIDYEEMTFVTYKGGDGHKVKIFYQIEDDDQSYKESLLEEILPGMYVSSMHFFQADHVKYRLEEEEELVEDPEYLKFETFDYEGEDSRFFELNRLDTQEDEINYLNEYLKKAFFADQYMKLL